MVHLQHCTQFVIDWVPESNSFRLHLETIDHLILTIVYGNHHNDFMFNPGHKDFLRDNVPSYDLRPYALFSGFFLKPKHSLKTWRPPCGEGGV